MCLKPPSQAWEGYLQLKAGREGLDCKRSVCSGSVTTICLASSEPTVISGLLLERSWRESGVNTPLALLRVEAGFDITSCPLFVGVKGKIVIAVHWRTDSVKCGKGRSRLRICSDGGAECFKRGHGGWNYCSSYRPGLKKYIYSYE